MATATGARSAWSRRDRLTRRNLELYAFSEWKPIVDAEREPIIDVGE